MGKGWQAFFGRAVRLAAHAAGLQERYPDIVPDGEVLDDGGAAALEGGVKDDGRVDVEMTQRGIGPGNRGELVAGARRQRRRIAFRRTATAMWPAS